MFDSIRNHKKYLMGFLMILIIPSFIFVGIEGYTNFDQSGEEVATVDGTEITQVEWDQAHQIESQRLREAMPTLDARLLDSPGARYATLERLVRDRVLATAAHKLNLFTSDQRLARELQQNEAIAALRKPDGSLDVERYTQLVARQGLTPPEVAQSGVELFAVCSKREVKGEIVVLVDRAPEVEASAESIEAALASALQTMSVKDAASFVSQTLGVSRKIAYKVALDRSQG